MSNAKSSDLTAMPSAIVRNKNGSYGVDFGVLAAELDLDARDRRQASLDMARLLGQEPPAAGRQTNMVLPSGAVVPVRLRTGPGAPTPREMIRPPVMPDMTEHAGPASPANLSDIPGQLISPGERYWETWDQGRAMPKEMPVAEKKPRLEDYCERFPLPPAAEHLRPLLVKCFFPMLERLFKEHETRFKEKLKCGTYFVQPQTHLAPPISAICLDVFTRAEGVPLAATATPVLDFTVPDRFLVVADKFGNDLIDRVTGAPVAPAVLFPTVWSMQRNETPIRCYANFNDRLGVFVDPTKFGSPLVLKNNERFQLVAQQPAATHNAKARLSGWAFAVVETPGDGTFVEYHTE